MPLDINMQLAGCSAKLRASKLSRLLSLKSVGDLFADTGKIDSYSNLRFTIDTILPITLDLGLFGKISLFHALSDLIATGAYPKGICLSLGLGLSLTLEEARILEQSIINTLKINNISLVNGHTYTCDNSSITVCAIGELKREQSKILEDETYYLILNKPIGGALSLAAGYLLNNEELIQSGRQLVSINPMAFTNLVSNLCVQGSTDISGFGLLGHIVTMANCFKVSVQINSSLIPINPYAIKAIEAMGPECSSSRNMTDFNKYCDWRNNNIAQVYKYLYFASETSGPILSIIHSSEIEFFISKAQELGYPDTCLIGTLQKATVPSVIIS